MMSSHSLVQCKVFYYPGLFIEKMLAILIYIILPATYYRPFADKYLSASNAAIQPLPAAVTACR